MTNWINKNKNVIIRTAFIIPILLVAIISISHVVKWYNLANPISWAIYLSIAIEVAAMSAIAASAVRVKGFSVWFIFIIVTLIQFIGNIFYSYQEIDQTSKGFLAWVELTQPIFQAFGDDTNSLIAQKRLLAFLEGGLLPLISLTCLHFFIQYDVKEENSNLESQDFKTVEDLQTSETIDVPEEQEQDSTKAQDDPIETESAEVIEIKDPTIESTLDLQNQRVELIEQIEEFKEKIEETESVIEEIKEQSESLMTDLTLNNQLSSTKKITGDQKKPEIFGSKMKRIRKQ